MNTEENNSVYESLLKSKQALEKAQEIGNLGHWELEIESGKLHWSKHIYTIFRLSPEEFDPSYEKFLDVIHPEDRKMVNDAYTFSLANKTPYQVEHRLLFDDGSVAYVSEKCETFYDEQGHPVRSMGTVQDVTDRVLIDQQLKESEAKFKAYANQSSEGVTVADMDGNYVFVNPAFCKMSGYTEKELLTMSVFDMKAIDQDHGSFMESKEKSVGLPIRVNLKRKDGTSYFTEIIGDVITVNGQQLVMGTIRNITKLVEDEQKIKTLNENLERLVQQRTNELDQTIANLKQEVNTRVAYEKQIKESLHIKEVLLKEITHRVKNNLQIISSLLKLQKGNIEHPESINIIEQAVNRIQSMALIHETLYKSEGFEQIKMANYTNALVDYANKTFENSNVEIVTDIDNHTFSIDTATSCGMIIMELITNAIKYAFVDHQDPIIEISIKKMNENDYKMIFRDNGIGLPDEIDFKNAKSLGMQIIMSLVEQLDGSIKLIPNASGTCFEVYLKDTKKKRLLA